MRGFGWLASRSYQNPMISTDFGSVRIFLLQIAKQLIFPGFFCKMKQISLRGKNVLKSHRILRDI
jgi:hypothetical protein